MRELSLTPQDTASRACSFPCPPSLYVSYPTPNYCSYHGLQWSLSSRHSHFARRFILILKILTKGTKMMHSSIQTRPHLRFSLERRVRSSVRSAGCAAILSTITAISHTRHFLSFSSPFHYPGSRAFSVFLSFAQAALAHLEEIIYDPYEQQRENQEADSKVNGTPEEGQISDGEEPS